MRTTRTIVGQWRGRLAALLLSLALAACGGGGGGGGGEALPAATGGVAVIGAAGGEVSHADGARVSFPAGALHADTTVSIAKNGEGAPPLPPMLVPAGAVHSITPHGGAFAMLAEVAIPVEQRNLADNEQLLLVTAEPGDAQWRVVSGAVYANGVLRASVAHFSFFQPVVVRDLVVPALVTSIDGKNNNGYDGAAVMSADYEISRDVSASWPAHSLIARLRFPDPPLRLPGSGSAAQRCAPASYGHDGAAWRFQRDTQILAYPLIEHLAYVQPQAGYPRTEAEFAASPNASTRWVPGFGALHFYGQDAPRRGDWGRPSAPELAGDVWATPPAGNVLDDDVLSWRASVRFDPALHNGRMLVSVTVPTACGLFIEAPALMFQLNQVTAWTGSYWTGFDGLPQVEAISREPVTLEFRTNTRQPVTESISMEFSSDPVNWEGRPLPAGAVALDRYNIHIASPTLDHQGWYRARACGYSLESQEPSTCVAGVPTRLTIVNGSLPEFQLLYADVGGVLTSEPAVRPGGSVTLMAYVYSWGPRASVSWQKRSLAQAAFGFTDWTPVDTPAAQDIDCTNNFETWIYRDGRQCTDSRLTLTPTLADSYTQYRAVASNSRGSVVGNPPLLLLVTETGAPPTVSSQPGDVSVPAGATAAFTATIAGTQPISYQWQFNEADLPGANSATLILHNVSAAQAGRYRLVARNPFGGAVTLHGTLAVTAPDAPPVVLPPTIAAQPAGVTVVAGQSAQFAVAVNGSGPFSYQWLKNAAEIAGATGAGLSLAATTTADAGSYSVRVSNSAGSVTSDAAALAVAAAPQPPAPVPPVISTAPAGLAVLPGGGATFAVAASGSGPLGFQWRRNGSDIAGANAAVLHLPSVSALDAGAYAVEVRNAAGAVISPSASLVVIGAPTITLHPVGSRVDEGGSATLSVVAAGANLRYQWLLDNVAIAGATGPSYTTPALAAADSGKVYSVIVYNGAGLLFSQPATLTVTPTPAPSPEDKIAAGLNHTCAIDRSDTLYCWGNGVNGELGNGSTSFRDVPTRVSGLGAVKAVAAGSWATCAIDSADALWCWGSMGDLVPAQLSAAGVRVRAVGLGSDHGCYVDAAGQVYCWGNTSFGKRGDLNPGDAPNPVRRADDSLLRDAVAVAIGVNHSCAQLADGSVWCWGADVAFGTHDKATRVMRRLPDGSRMDFTATGRVVAGRYHSCALESSTGQPMCWGHNEQGQLGDGSTISRDDAMPADLFGGLSLAAGATHTCAIRTSDMYCWGYGFMGNGAERETLLAPVAAGRVGAYFNSADPPLAAAAGERHTCALRTSGDVQCWGWNNAGQAGNGSVSDTVNVLVPTSTTLGAQFWRR